MGCTYDNVFCDNTSNYQGRHRVNPTVVCSQGSYRSGFRDVSTLVHIGEVSGAPFMGLSPKSVWRVSPDGEVRDTFGKLEQVFEMDEPVFFEIYGGVEREGGPNTSYHSSWAAELVPSVRAVGTVSQEKTVPSVGIGGTAANV